jgi:CRP/FNR family transcriptional regulator
MKIFQTIKASCSNCNLRELCMPMGLDDEQMERIDEIVATRRKIKRGGLLFRNGRVHLLYAIRTGFFKTSVATEDGRDQVTGFQMAGEIIGLDGIVNDHHTLAMPWPWKTPRSVSCRLTNWSSSRARSRAAEPCAQGHEPRNRARAWRDAAAGQHACRRAPGGFVLNLVQRLSARGFSKSELVLRMTREEIGSYLGLKLGNRGRTFSKFAEEGIMEVKQRHLRILDTGGAQTHRQQPAMPELNRVSRRTQDKARGQRAFLSGQLLGQRLEQCLH